MTEDEGDWLDFIPEYLSIPSLPQVAEGGDEDGGAHLTRLNTVPKVALLASRLQPYEERSLLACTIYFLRLMERQEWHDTLLEAMRSKPDVVIFVPFDFDIS